MDQKVGIRSLFKLKSKNSGDANLNLKTQRQRLKENGMKEKV